MKNMPEKDNKIPAGTDAFSRNTGERHIYVMDANESGDWSPSIFPLSSVERIAGCGEKNSFLILRSGHKIFVTLPCHELHRKIYAPDFKADDMKLLDLGDFTGPATEAVFPRTVGAMMPDGTVYAGQDSLTGRHVFAMPEDAPLSMPFNAAAQYAANLNKEKKLGHSDWRVPSVKQLELLYLHRHKGSLKGTFNESGAEYKGFYWTADERDNAHGNSRNFNNGAADFGYFKTREMSVRCVRTEADF